METIRIMVINWKWSDLVGYPTYIADKLQLANNDSIEFENEFVFLPATHAGNVKIGDDENYQGKDERYSRYVVPTKVDLGLIDKESRSLNKDLQRLQIDYFNQIIRKCKLFSPQVKAIEFLFLHHLGHGFDDLTDFVGFLYNHNSKLGFFGNAAGTMYGEKGLLPFGMAAFRFEEGAEVGWFNPKEVYKVTLIKEDHFDFVWEHYYYKKSKEKVKTLLAEIYKRVDDKIVHAKGQKIKEFIKLLLNSGPEKIYTNSWKYELLNWSKEDIEYFENIITSWENGAEIRKLFLMYSKSELLKEQKPRFQFLLNSLKESLLI